LERCRSMFLAFMRGSGALALAMSYLKVGFAGEHTDSNHRLMYTWA
jgi:hypothetical protein